MPISPNLPESFTMDYFRQEIVNLRQMWGQQPFWDKPSDIRKKALEALSFCYFNINFKNDAEMNTAATMLDSTLTEYSMREFKMIMSGKTKGIA